MAFDRKDFVKLLENSYSAYYNIIKEDLPQDLPMEFRADYFQRGEKFWLLKSIPMYGNETNEYAYIFSADSFDEDMIDKCITYALDDGLPRVKPHKEHQYTNIKTIFIATDFTADAERKIKNTEFQKTYNHSFWGYSNLLNSAVDVDSETVYTNRAGHEMKAYFRKLFAAQKKE